MREPEVAPGYPRGENIPWTEGAAAKAVLGVPWRSWLASSLLRRIAAQLPQPPITGGSTVQTALLSMSVQDPDVFSHTESATEKRDLDQNSDKPVLIHNKKHTLIHNENNRPC